MNLYDMKLGESFWSSEMDSSILRVPGGWLFRIWDQEHGVHTSSTFVPFDNEFMGTADTKEEPQNSSASPVQQLKQAIALVRSEGLRCLPSDSDKTRLAGLLYKLRQRACV